MCVSVCVCVCVLRHVHCTHEVFVHMRRRQSRCREHFWGHHMISLALCLLTVSEAQASIPSLPSLVLLHATLTHQPLLHSYSDLGERNSRKTCVIGLSNLEME